MSRSRNRRRTPPRTSVPAELTPRAEWEPESDLEPVATQPPPDFVEPVPRLALSTDLVRQPRITTEELAAIAKLPKCAHCGGHHVRACPRVHRMSFHPDGALASVEFWATGKWSEDNVLYLDELTADE